MTRIAIAGIGGVGGYFGGHLARHYRFSSEAEVLFIARGENEKKIRESGLQLLTTAENFTAFPELVSSNPQVIGAVDLLICTTKSYDLEKTLTDLSPCIHSGTVILPLLNGVDSAPRIRQLYPENLCPDGCVYLVSRLVSPGLIKETGGIARLLFGAENGDITKLKKIETLLRNAGLDASFQENIQQVIWEKFVFISCIATMTSFADLHFGPMLKDKNCREYLVQLLNEVHALAMAKQIPLAGDIVAATMRKIESLPDDTTSSMHSDFQKGKETEIGSLTGYVVNEAKRFGIPVPVFEMMYADLQKRKGAAYRK